MLWKSCVGSDNKCWSRHNIFLPDLSVTVDQLNPFIAVSREDSRGGPGTSESGADV